MTKRVLSLFEKATSPEPSKQAEFAENLPEIISFFPQEFIRTKFIPFLVDWLPANDGPVRSTVSGHITQIAKSSGSIFHCSRLIEKIVSADSKETNKRLSRDILSFRGEHHASKLLLSLTKSKYDCVRAFVPSIIEIIEDEDSQRTIVTQLVYDVSFRVRFAAAKLIKTLPSLALACQIAVTLMDDQQGQIRAVIPVASAKRQFLVSHVIPNLEIDHDWAVRASVASELVHCKERDEALKCATKLADDGVWQVKLCAMRSMAGLIHKMKSLNHVKDIIRILSENIKYPQQTIKNTVIDTFLEIYSKTTKHANLMGNFITSAIMMQTQQVKLHFLTMIVAQKQTKILQQIKTSLYGNIYSLVRNDQWRVRLGAVKLLSGLNLDPELQESFSKLCLQMINDEANPVREAAANQFADFLASNHPPDGKIPSAIRGLSKSDTFRERQAAILILKDLSKRCQKKSDKDGYIHYIKKFLKDPCSNVVLFAQASLDELK